MKSGNVEGSFIEAYDMYSDAIFRYCSFKVFDRERAKDLMQETFTRTWTYLREGKKIDNIKAFLYRVAHNVCVNEIARSKAVSLEEMQELFAFDPSDISQHLEVEADAQIALRHLSNLEPAFREVLTLRFMQGLSVGEIAVLLQEQPNTISVRIHRALLELKKRMELP